MDFPFAVVTFQVDAANAGEQKAISIGGMSVKLTSDSSDEKAMVVVDTITAAGTVNVVKGISYSAICLYTGDDVDLIPTTKKAVAVSVVGIENATKLTYNDGTNQYVFKYSAEISAKTGIATYVALVDASIAMENFANKQNFTFTEDTAAQIIFGDTNGDGAVNLGDIARMFAHVRGAVLMADSYELQCADVDRNGMVNIGDVARCYAAVCDS